VTPEQRKAETIATLCGQLEALCATHPVLLLFEDAHWADPTSIEVLDTLVDAARGLRALLVVTFRPEFTPNWQGHGHVSELRLSRLTQRDIRVRFAA
jgi:predicted ATPase